MALILTENFDGATPGQTLQAYNPAYLKTASAPGDSVITDDQQLRNAGGSTSGYYRSDVEIASADYSVSADVTKGTSILGVTGRTLANATFYQARLNGNLVELSRFNAGAGNTLGSRTLAGNASTVNLRLEMIGTSIKIYLDGQAEPFISAVNNVVTAAGYMGVRSGVGSGSIDNIRVTTADAGTGIQLTISHIEGSESNSIAARAVVDSEISHTEASESHAIGIGMEVRAAISHAEAGESNAISGRVDVLASANWTEGNEATSAAIQVGGGVLLSINHVESNETHVIAARIAVSAAISHFEAGDSHSIVVQVVGGEIGDIDALLVPPRQTVVFEGSRRVVAFEGGQRVVSFEGSKRLVEFQ